VIGKYLAWTIIVVSALASIGYGCGGDWRRMVYWAAAATLNVAVTI